MNEGYLRMQGPPEVTCEPGYLPMVPESESDSDAGYLGNQVDDDVIYLTDVCCNYDNLSQRIRLPSTASQRAR